ncbi:MAG: 50S ribosomal protein L13 [Deltaproteobacteria bacterium]|jgi:large subunit ribosomal protein L13|nr:50S ribosomal protein L13 [Deltaproteobacteria bacterium]
MKTPLVKNENIKPKWHLVDADGRILGRLATRVAILLRGKNKPIFAPHQDTGDFVVVINAKKVALTGKKWKEKIYFHHSGYPGGLKEASAEKIRDKKPERLITMAVQGMLPKTKLGKKLIKKLKVYAGDTHPHEAQQPEAYTL